MEINQNEENKEYIELGDKVEKKKIQNGTKNAFKENLNIEILEPRFKNDINDLKKILGDTIILHNFNVNVYSNKETGVKNTYYKAELVAPKYTELFSKVDNIVVYFENEESYNKYKNKTIFAIKDININSYNLKVIVNSGVDSNKKKFNYNSYMIKDIVLS